MPDFVITPVVSISCFSFRVIRKVISPEEARDLVCSLEYFGHLMIVIHALGSRHWVLAHSGTSKTH